MLWDLCFPWTADHLGVASAATARVGTTIETNAFIESCVAHHGRNNVAHAWSSSHAPENLAEQSCQEISVAASAAITFAGSSWGLVPAGITSSRHRCWN
jgi:hypothetical protein